VNNRT